MSHRLRLALGLALLLLSSWPGEADASPSASNPQGAASSTPRADHVAPPTSRPHSEPSVADDLGELRRFEESAFPRPVPRPEPGPDTGPPPRPSTETPPPGLHSDEHRAASGPPRAGPPEPWLARLALPDLPIRWDPKLIRYLEFYKNNPTGRAIMSAWLRRAGRYSRMISEALSRHKLPQSLMLVAMIESGFNPRTTSHAGAAGLWQFMPVPGRAYGLHRDHWVDERRNPEKSTEAALRFLKHLYQRFGSWELALAAYNCGDGGLVLAIRKYNTNDYWKLSRYEAGLPWDTVLYVPKILAAAVVVNNRGVFGFDQITPDPEIPVALVSVPSSMTLAQAANAAGVSRDLLEQLNPELQRGRTPPGKSWLRVPKSAEQRFYATLPRIKGELARYRPYLVRLGDSLVEVARAHGTSAAALRSLNGIEPAAELRPGLTILVPARPAAVRQSREADEESGEGEEEVALVPLPADKPASVPGRRRVLYRTAMGDTLEEIARYLGVRTSELAGWNSLDERARLVSGMVLQAFVSERFDSRKVVLLDPKRVKLMRAGSEEFYTAYEERRGRKRIIYQIKEGDTLSAVARRHGLTVGDVMRINQVGRQTKLRPGSTLVLYVDLARLRPRRPPASAGKPRVAGSDKVVPSPPITADEEAGPPALGTPAGDSTGAATVPGDQHEAEPDQDRSAEGDAGAGGGSAAEPETATAESGGEHAGRR